MLDTAARPGDPAAMLFRLAQPVPLAISQPAHAWISGQLLRAWATPLPEPVLLAAEQHDIGWLDWETDPGFDPATGRPFLFRHLGAAVHAPMWARGIERARAAWGTHVGLLVSRHGCVIYTRFTDRSRMAPADADAAERFLATQRAFQAGWAEALGLDDAQLARETALIALSDTLSLALCGEVAAPVALELPDGPRLQLEPTDTPDRFTLDPWPFRPGPLVVEAEARPMPPEARFADEPAMRRWFSGSDRVRLRVTLVHAAARSAPAAARGFPGGPA